MADKSHIEWTDATWNPITGCSVVSPGCTNCYAMKLAGTRLKNHPSRAGLTIDTKAGPVWNGEVRFNKEWLTQPLRWKKPRMVFVCAHGDLFHEDVPEEWIDLVFAVMALCPQHTFQVLTKRSDRMLSYLTKQKNPGSMAAQNRVAWEAVPTALSIAGIKWKHLGIYEGWRARAIEAGTVWPLPNVWLGVSVEDQERANKRIPKLLETPAAVRWISAEPLLGSVDLTKISLGSSDANFYAGPHLKTVEFFINALAGVESFNWPGIDWVVVGGESGNDTRPMHPDWARSIREQCKAHGTRFFFKQWGSHLPWEPAGQPPFWESQNGQHEDGHTLFPSDMDADPNWDDGLTFINTGCSHAAFQKVGKNAASDLLDGIQHHEWPELQNPQTGLTLEVEKS